LRRTSNWPRFIELVEGDNCLCVDLANPISVDTLLEELRDKTTIIIRESFIPDIQPAVRGPEGGFCHELIVPFLGNMDLMPASKSDPEHRTRVPEELGTDYLPGGEWMYLKLYGGTAALETIVKSHLGDLVACLTKKMLVTKWFFIRYADPNWHLRIRFNGIPERLWSEALPIVHEFLNSVRTQELTWKISIDTYEPEFARYGGLRAMQLTEDVFNADSDFAVSFLSDNRHEDPSERWLWVAYSVDQFYEAAGFPVATRGSIYAKIASAQRVKYGESKRYAVSVDRKYRQCRDRLESLFFGFATTPETKPVWLAERDSRLKKLLPALQATLRDAKAFEGVIVDQVHVSINRLCVASAVAQELLLYELLTRLYRSIEARSRGRK